MGADWRDLTWNEYQARLWHWNRRHGDTDAPSEPDYDRIRKMMVH
jgi:hypothetical protein